MQQKSWKKNVKKIPRLYVKRFMRCDMSKVCERSLECEIEGTGGKGVRKGGREGVREVERSEAIRQALVSYVCMYVCI